ncbi:MAG: polyprenyl synthetase family protein [Lachnospiraceae bacterium]|nr:polyprenyl synthetase family protein [Lachnospiraceae bacterium]
MNFEKVLEAKTGRAEAVLKRYMPEETGYQSQVLKAMNYSVSAGGKRLRPILMEESFLLFGGQGELVEPFMAALEMIHNYSLVHDDLPAMDNDEYRRGRETTWKVYGDGMAVLAGDGLLNLAFETAAGAFDLAKTDKEFIRAACAIRILGRKSGVYGMIGGQTADIMAESGTQVTEEMLLFIHENKTAALIQAALMIGAVLAGADASDVARMERAAYNIGVAFQIQDDILDVTSTTEVLGKPVGSDERNQKLTYVALHGLDKSREEVRRLSAEALGILNSYEDKNEFLIKLVESLVTREK